MKRSGVAKFPNSVQLFKFCQKVMIQQKNGKVNDQEIGRILGFNPSDCSHWKCGEKNIKSVFAMAKLAETLQVEPTLIHDIASGMITLDEAFFEYMASKSFTDTMSTVSHLGEVQVQTVRDRIETFVKKIHEDVNFTTAPLYLPEVTRLFTFVTSQPTEMMDRLSRVLRLKPGKYAVQFRKGELKPQTRMSVARDLARIILDAERSRFPELGDVDEKLINFEVLTFVATLMAPKALIQNELHRLDARKNVVSELATIFWVPKSLIGFQIQDCLRTETKHIGIKSAVTNPEVSNPLFG